MMMLNAELKLHKQNFDLDPGESRGQITGLAGKLMLSRSNSGFLITVLVYYLEGFIQHGS